MTPRGDNRNAPPVDPGEGMANPLQWVTRWLAEQRAPRVPALRPPRPPRLRIPRRRPHSAAWDARAAARAGIPLDDYLQHRLSRQLVAISVPATRLPIAIAVDPDGGLAVTPGPPRDARRAPWLESFLRAHGWGAVRPELQLAQADVARVSALIDAQRQRVDALAREQDALSADRELADPADETQAQQMGRPPVPAPVGLALRVFALALLAAETWQLAVPCLEVAGIRTASLALELHRNPLGVVLGALFGLGAAASLFAFAHFALHAKGDAADAAGAQRRRWFLGVARSVAAAGAIALAWSAASALPGARQPADLRAARLAVFLAALALPVTATWLLSLARELDAVRDAALARARAWDTDHYRALAELSRHGALVAEEERRLARLESQRAAAVRRLRALQQRGATAERLAADAADEDEAALARLAQAIVSALELDRYEYLRQSARLRRPCGTLEPHPAHAAGPLPSASARDRDGAANLGFAG